MYSYSVIMPIYNGAQTLEATLDSLFDQILPEDDMEVICINDCSEDATADVLNKYTNYSQLKIITLNERKPTGAVRNIGINIANKEHICFLDADDFIHLNVVRKLIDRMTSCDIGIAAYNNTPLHISISDNMFVFETESLFNVLFQCTNAACWNKIYRAGFIRSNHIKFNDNTFAEDMYFTYSALLNSKMIAFLNENIITYTSPHANVNKRRYDGISIVDNLFATFRGLYDVLCSKKLNVPPDKYIALVNSYQALVCEHAAYQKSLMSLSDYQWLSDFCGKLSFEIIYSLREMRQ